MNLQIMREFQDEPLLRAIVDTVADGVIVMDAEQRVTMANSACERLFGYANDEIVGWNVCRLIRNVEEPQRKSRGERGASLWPVPSVGETFGWRKGGDTFPAELSIGETLHKGRVLVVGVVRDLTDRRLADELRRRLFEQLTVSNEEQTCFTHAASHDLREPLRMVKAYCGLLLKDYGPHLDQRGREFLYLAAAASNHMSDLLEDLADYGRLGHEQGNLSWFCSRDCFLKSISVLYEQITLSNALVTADLYLPEIYGNPIRFQRLIQNLIANALKFVEVGVEPRIHVSAARHDGLWYFSVSDNGLGIERRHFARIFEPFSRLHSRVRFHGTGLGLAICRRIVRDFGGEISVTSSLGAGSTFTFTINSPEPGNGESNG